MLFANKASKIKLTSSWLTNVAKATGLTEEKLKKDVYSLWDKGYSREYIQSTLTSIASQNNKRLIFVSKKVLN